MSTIDQLIQKLISTVRDNYFVALNTAGAAALVGYDILLTLEDEIDLVWRSSWSFINVVHLLIRYHGLTYLLTNLYTSINTHLSVAFCHPWYPYQIWGAVFVVPAADVLVVTRLFALYNRSRKVGALLGFLWFSELAFLCGFIGSQLKSTAVMENPLPGVLAGCFPVMDFEDGRVVQSSVIAIVIQVLYLGLALNILFRRVRTAMSPLLTIFFRDGALYCLVILIMYVVNILFLVYANGRSLQVIGQQWLVAVVTVTAGRMVLNLRSSVRKPYVSFSSNNTTSDPPRRGQQHSEDIELGEFTSVIVIESPRSPRMPANRPWSPEGLHSPWSANHDLDTIPSTRSTQTPSAFPSTSISSTTLQG